MDRLIQVSGPNVFNGTGEFDIATDDVFLEADFEQLEDALRNAAFQLCAPSVTVRNSTTRPRIRIRSTIYFPAWGGR